MRIKYPVVREIKESHHFLWLIVALMLIVVILLSPPLVLAKKLMNSHPVSTEKQMTRCNPCPFNSINRPSYEIMVPSVDLWLVLTEPAELYLGQPSDSTSIAEESKTSLSPLRC